MVAAGGGINSTAAGGTLYGYNDKMNSFGGFIKSQGTTKDFSLLPLNETGIEQAKIIKEKLKDIQ